MHHVCRTQVCSSWPTAFPAAARLWKLWPELVMALRAFRLRIRQLPVLAPSSYPAGYESIGGIIQTQLVTLVCYLDTWRKHNSNHPLIIYTYPNSIGLFPWYIENSQFLSYPYHTDPNSHIGLFPRYVFIYKRIPIIPQDGPASQALFPNHPAEHFCNYGVATLHRSVWEEDWQLRFRAGLGWDWVTIV